MFNTTDSSPLQDPYCARKRLKRKLKRFSSVLEEHRFAQSGDMFRKYVPESDWNQPAQGLPKPIAEVVKARKKLAKAATTKIPIRHPRADYSYPKANENFSYRAMRKADIEANLGGEHTEYLAKRKDLVDQFRNAQKKGLPTPTVTVPVPSNQNIGKAARDRVKRRVKQTRITGTPAPVSEPTPTEQIPITQAVRRLDKDYIKEVEKRPGYKMSLSRKRMNIRKNMAEELRSNRDIIQGSRKSRGTLPAPLPPEKMAMVKARPLLGIKVPDRGHGIGLAHQIPIEIGGKVFTKDEYKGSIVSTKAELQQRVNQRLQHMQNRSKQLDQALRNRAAKTIQGQRKQLIREERAERFKSGTGRTKLTRPYKQHELVREVNKAVYPIKQPIPIPEETRAPERAAAYRKQAAFKTGTFGTAEKVARSRMGQSDIKQVPMTPFEGSRAEQIAARIGLRKPSDVARLHNRWQKLSVWSQTGLGESVVRKRILDEGNIFREAHAPVPTVKGYPYFKKIGKIGAIGAGVVTAGLLARKLFKKKETQMSSLDEVLNFDYRDIKKKADEQDGTLGHDVAIGAVEGAVSTAAYERLLAKMQPKGLLGKSALAAGLGGLGTATVGYGLNKLMAAKKKRQTPRVSGVAPTTSYMHSRVRPIEFRNLITRKAIRGGDKVFYKGKQIDIKQLNRNVSDRAATRVPIASLRHTTKAKRSGFLEKKLKYANANAPVLVHRGELVDGRHRSIKKKDRGETHVSRIPVTRSDLERVMMQNVNHGIHFDEGYSTPFPTNKKKRLTVAQDRYRKQIHHQEMDRIESNVTKSTIAGSVLAAALRKKASLKSAGALGAGLGAAASIGATVLNRHKKDVYGDRSYAAKREERLPYQVPALAAGGLAVRKIYKQLHTLSARTKLIQFALTDEEKRKRRFQRKWLKPESWPRRGEDIYEKYRRTKLLTEDVVNKVKGTPIKDERGRKRDPQWSKPWFKKTAITAALAGVIVGGRVLPKSKMVQKILEKPFVTKTVAKGSELYHGTKADIAKFRERFVDPSPEKAYKQKQAELRKAEEAAEELKRKTREATEGRFSVRFAEKIPDWDIRDQRGNSARIYAPGSQKRERREKKWYERKDNQKLLLEGAAAIGVPIAGAGAYSAYRLGQRSEHKVPVKKTPFGYGVIEGGITKAKASKLKNLFKLQAISGYLDEVINFQA